MLRLNQLKENLESDIISYDNFVKIINNDNSITIKEFFELMNDSIAKQIITSDFKILDDYISTIRNNIESEYKTDSNSEYTYEPNKDGGIFTQSLVLSNPNLGLLDDIMNITTVADIKIDFRPNCYSYVGIHFIKDAYSKENRINLLGEYNYIYHEVNLNGDLLDFSIESM